MLYFDDISKNAILFDFNKNVKKFKKEIIEDEFLNLSKEYFEYIIENEF